MKNKWKLLIPLGIFLLPLLVVGGVYLFRPEPQPTAPVPPGLTVEQKLELLRDKNAVVAYLEMNQYTPAMPALEKIVRELPDEPFGHRNLALALFNPSDTNVDSNLGHKDTEQVQRLLATLERLLALDSQSFATQYIAGRIYAKQAELFQASEPGRIDEALAQAKKHFREAAKLSPQDPGPLFEIYWQEKRYSLDQLSQEGFEALRQSHHREPDNLPCLLELLEQLVLRKDPERNAIVERVLRLLPADVDNVFEGAKPRRSIEKIAKLLAEKPNEIPFEALGELRAVRGVLKQFFGFYQSDESRLRPHPLAFVAQDFQSSFYADLPADSEPAIPVTFTPIEPWKNLPEGIIAAKRDDLTCNNDYAVVLLRSEMRGKTRIETVAESDKVKMPAVEVEGEFTALELADLDLDIRTPTDDSRRNIPADLDLILYGPSGIRLLENREENGSRRWVDRTADCKLPPLQNVKWLLCCDMDHDGNIDLIVGLEKGVRILRNQGAWAFEDVTNRSTGLDGLETVAAVFGDFNRDGNLDFMVLRKDGLLLFLDNRRAGKFEVRDTGVQVKEATCLTTADFNGDGRLDFAVGHSSGVAIFFADERGMPAAKAPARIDLRVRASPTKIGAFDYDNDGWQDIWFANDLPIASGLHLFRNIHGSGFEEATGLLPDVSSGILNVQVADLDNDGDVDFLYIARPGRLKALRNDGGNKNHWLNLQLHAELSTDAVRSNYRCIGGLAEIRAGQHYQLQQITGSVTHFGLGHRSKADAVRVVWTNGIPQDWVRPKIDQTMVENQRPKGSCPYLFAWNGERFEFITDCFWSGGLGVKQTHDKAMPHDRQFVHLVLGDRLKPRNGRYVLQFTNELWEGAFLDQTQLWVVDHPADVEIFTNRRIPPDPNEEFKLLTVKQRRYPIAARDQNGHDVLSAILHRDGDCVGGLKGTRYVGLTEPHWLELDLGDLSSAKNATLFLTGWIWPGDTTASVAISQDPRFKAPSPFGIHPPTLLVPDGKGGWLTANAEMGSASGHMQTLAVPLPLEKFPPGDYRVRIATTAELYWDEAFFTVDESPVECTTQRLPVAAADLHYRGYSRLVQPGPTRPFSYDYADVDPRPRWLPIPGKCVRYGSVTELLQAADGCYVVMSPGDEVTLEFPELPPPPPGQKRTFIFHANAWLKDFDLNSPAGDRMSPYPFDGMSRYPYEPAETFPATELHRRFVNEYLRREVDTGTFWDQLRPSAGFSRVPAKPEKSAP